MTSVRRFLRPSCFAPIPSHLRAISLSLPLYLSPSAPPVEPRGSKRSNNDSASGSELSSFPSLFLSFCFAVTRESHTRVSAVWRGVAWRGVVWRGVAWCGGDAMWPRLDSIRVAAADRCVAMTTLPPPVIQLPPHTPLSRPPPPTLRVLRPPPYRRRAPTNPPDVDGWLVGWMVGAHSLRRLLPPP